jgi:hypothetical protein
MQPDLPPLPSKFRAGIRTIIIVVGSMFCVTMNTFLFRITFSAPMILSLLVSHGYGITYELKGVE